jgi:hypothetical protein
MVWPIWLSAGFSNSDGFDAIGAGWPDEAGLGAAVWQRATENENAIEQALMKRHGER